MFRKTHSGGPYRRIHGRVRSCAWMTRALAVCVVCAAIAAGSQRPVFAQTPDTPAAAVTGAPSAAPTSQPISGAAALPGPSASKRQRREAESAYMDGAKKLDRDELEAAQQQFERAARLNPANGSYAAAATVARQNRVMELVRKVSAARAGGDEAKAQTLLTQARGIDPENPLILEHAEPPMSLRAALPAQNPARKTDDSPNNVPPDTNGDAAVPWRIVPNAAGPIHLAAMPGTQTFDLSGDSTDVIRRVFQAFGIKTAIDNSVEHKNLRFNMDEVNYSQAIQALTIMADIFLVPVDETTVLLAKNDQGDRTRLQRQLEETIYLPGLPTDQFNETVQLLKGIFDKVILTPQPTLGAILVRAPENLIGPLNETVHGLQEDRGEVVVEVRLYEVDTTKSLNAGANIPTQFSIFNVDQAAAQLVSQNSSLVQQAIAQGIISPTASNFEIAAALLASGLVQSSLLNSTIGVFGGGVTRTGITETGSLGINLGLNSSDSRTLDDVQLRVRDREAATFREGTRYPITTSTYSTGIGIANTSSAALGSLGNATINGIPISSLLSQGAGSAVTVPQITYENLGITLEATPTVQKSGRISLKLKLVLAALTGNSVNSIPVLANREFDSDLTIGEGESALLSSLVSSSEVKSMSGLPGLSELPGFQVPITENTQNQKIQLVVVVTPHVVRRRSDLVAGPRIPMPPEAISQ